jgi:hypothetical protein
MSLTVHEGTSPSVNFQLELYIGCRPSTSPLCELNLFGFGFPIVDEGHSTFEALDLNIKGTWLSGVFVLFHSHALVAHFDLAELGGHDIDVFDIDYFR